MNIYRLFVEKKENDVSAIKLVREISNILKIKVKDLKRYIRYDVQGLTEDDLQKTKNVVFSEPPIDNVYMEALPELKGYDVFAVEFLPGQYDQRADSASQCVQLVTQKEKPLVRCATVYAVSGVNKVELETIKKYLINPVEAREATLSKPQNLEMRVEVPQKVAVLNGFINMTDAEIDAFHKNNSLAMTKEDLRFVRDYFVSEKRNPTITEIKVIDTYWSDHCRHTTFATEIKNIEVISENPHIKNALNLYNDLYSEFNASRKDKYKCLMDIATIAVKKLKKLGLLNNLDESQEINACSIKVKVDVNGVDEDWLIMFKNETHNHPTEIEPFGGAATCLGGAIRDPLSGRTYVYQAMRVTGASDPTVAYDKTIKGKLPQRVITTTAAHGFSSYGNQIGLATGQVVEVYHPNYVAKRLETGFVVGANKEENVVRDIPCEGDVVILLGGETGRDGCGGATGSSKAHTLESIDVCGAEVQKGNAPTERKLQKLFRNPEITKLIKRCNDFGAGGVCVAIGELSDSLDINLDLVPKKYDGLDGTELAISESQERMAVVIKKEDEAKFIALANDENLNAVAVAIITNNNRMRMFNQGDVIVDLSRDFLNTNGVHGVVDAVINEKKVTFFDDLLPETKKAIEKDDYAKALEIELSKLNVCSQKGLTENFDSTIGAKSVLMPYGGKHQLSPSISMVAKVPTFGETDTATVAAYGFSPYFMSNSPFVGSVHSILTSVAKVVATGAGMDTIRLTLQEFFKRLNGDKNRFGEPLSALLGALYAQINLGLGAIGGKDSMSGTFENIDVPPTLISFALGVEKASKVISSVIKDENKKLYLLKIKRDEFAMPNFEYAKQLFDAVHENIMSKNITFATVVEDGGYASAVAKGCLGNGFGFTFAKSNAEMFKPYFGDIVVSLENEKAFENFDIEFIGETTKDDAFKFGTKKLSQSHAVDAFTATLEDVFKTSAQASGKVENLNFVSNNVISRKASIVKPKVLIPAFPGTNCEYDTARSFEKAGAEPIIYVVKNRNASDIEKSVSDIASIIKKCQIVAFPGGFSGGDEPDGSGKFIVATFKNPKIKDAITELLEVRDGLMLGICNGFQALIKLGLVPNGRIVDATSDSPTLTYNNIARHVSTVSHIRVASNASPWFNQVKVGDVFGVAISHGEGKFLANEACVDKLIKNGQVATQYVDLNGNATMQSPYNPNGSVFAIEGITSLDGRVLGKMGHSERIGNNVMKNIDANFDMKIFESGVNYFK